MSDVIRMRNLFIINPNPIICPEILWKNSDILIVKKEMGGSIFQSHPTFNNWQPLA
jgi:hypothetical protein